MFKITDIWTKKTVVPNLIFISGEGPSQYGKREIFPFMPLSCGFDQRTDFHPSRVSYSCDNSTVSSRQGQRFIPRATPQAFPLTNPRYALLYLFSTHYLLPPTPRKETRWKDKWEKRRNKEVINGQRTKPRTPIRVTDALIEDEKQRKTEGRKRNELKEERINLRVILVNMKKRKQR